MGYNYIFSVFPTLFLCLQQLDIFKNDHDSEYFRYSRFKVQIVRFHVALSSIQESEDFEDESTSDKAIDAFEAALNYCVNSLDLINPQEKEAATATLLSCCKNYCEKANFTEKSIQNSYFHLEESFHKFGNETKDKRH